MPMEFGTNGPSIIARRAGGGTKRRTPFEVETADPFASIGGKDARMGEVHLALGDMFMGKRPTAKKQRDELAF